MLSIKLCPTTDIPQHTRDGIKQVIMVCFKRTSPPNYWPHQTEAVVWCEDLSSTPPKPVAAAVLMTADKYVPEPEVPLYFLQSLGVLPEYRGQGIATLLLEKVHSEHIPTALHVDKGALHEQLVQWYTRHGYTRMAKTKRLPLDNNVESLLVATAVVPQRVLDTF